MDNGAREWTDEEREELAVELKRKLLAVQDLRNAADIVGATWHNIRDNISIGEAGMLDDAVVTIGQAMSRIKERCAWLTKTLA